MLSKKEKFLKYWIPFTEKIYLHDAIVEENDYLIFKDHTKTRIIRHINGKTINIVGNIFATKKHHDEVLIILHKIFKRYIKEYHRKFVIFRIKNSCKKMNMDFFVNLVYNYPSFGKMLKLYLFNLIK